MEPQSFYVEFRERGEPIHHAEARCEWTASQWFKCSSCERRVCYCGGHCGLGTLECRTNCGKCDECCALPDGAA